MQFLPNVTVACEVCQGARYNREALEITFKDATISDVLNMTVSEALEFFWNFPKVRNKLETMRDVGLGYIKLGQPATTLLRRRSAASQTLNRAVPEVYRQDPKHSGRTNHRPVIPGLRRPVGSVAPAGGFGQYGGLDRAPSGLD